MVARRLLILLLVLLGISTLAAALAPVKSPKDKTTTTTATTATPTVTTPSAPPAKSAGLFKYTIDANSKNVNVIELYVGEELLLTVKSKLYDQVSIPKLGQIEPVSPGFAAKFDLYLDHPGTSAVRLIGANRLVGRLRVSPGARPEKARGKARPHRGQR
ncbi:MAG: hypothetical protein QOD60_215 [Solirubrobacterales bacterium]|jgi:hypothetical protein|nr:hypothetical protein [Solirubrobacterales bacterium]